MQRIVNSFAARGCQRQTYAFAGERLRLGIGGLRVPMRSGRWSSPRLDGRVPLFIGRARRQPPVVVGSSIGPPGRAAFPKCLLCLVDSTARRRSLLRRPFASQRTPCVHQLADELLPLFRRQCTVRLSPKAPMHDKVPAVGRRRVLVAVGGSILAVRVRRSKGTQKAHTVALTGSDARPSERRAVPCMNSWTTIATC